MNLTGGGIKIWLGETIAGGFFLVGDEQSLGSWGDSHFQLVKGWGSSPAGKTLIFRLLFFKQTADITRVLIRPER